MSTLFPIASFSSMDIDEANELLVLWNHRMGPICRPQFQPDIAHALYHGDRPVALTVTSQMITSHAAREASYLTRDNTIELSRLCACRPGLCRVALRLWREFVFSEMSHEFAMSYQDADIHSGNIYRFDGWQRIAFSPKGGRDRRSGAEGRNKWIWQWPPIKLISHS